MGSENNPFLGGEDWFEFVAEIHFRKSVWQKLSAQFTHLQKSYGLKEMDNPGIMESGEHEIRVAQYGQKIGGANGFFMPYIIHCYGIKIGFLPPELAGALGWNAQIIVRSLPLIQAGSLEYVIAFIKEIFTGLGGSITTTSLSRVDVCVDIPEMDVSTFATLFTNGCMVCRGKKAQIFSVTEHYNGASNTGLSIIEKKQSTGLRTSGQILIRIYDKIAEMRTTQDVLKMEAMQQRYGGALPEKATRIEFQLRTKALRNWGVKTIPDWLKQREGIVKYLTEDYVKFCTKRTKHCLKTNHHSRIRIAPKWKIIQKTFAHVFGKSAKKRMPQKPIRNPDQSALEKQIVGCIATLGALQGKTIETGKDFLQLAMQAGKSVTLNAIKIKSIQRRQKKYFDSGNAIGETRI